MTCSTDYLFQKEVAYLKNLFYSNGYPIPFLTKFYANFKTKKQTVKLKENLSIFLSFPTLEKSQKNSVYKFNH